jgi:hypothetical protein
MDYPVGYTQGESKYNIPCVKCRQNKRQGKTCKNCKDSEKHQREFTEKSTELNDSIQKRLGIIEEIDIEYQKAHEEYKRAQEKMISLEVQKKFTLSSIELEQLQLEIHQVQGNYDYHLISDDIREYVGTQYNGERVELETHCTIVRIDDSLEDVYFGHVTLVITYPREVYKWHYGAEVYNQLPKNLEHKFWQTHVDGQTKFDAEKTKVSHFGHFDDILTNTKLSDMMKNHYDDCIRFFYRKKEWPPNQIWNKDSEYESVKADSRLEQLLLKSEKLEVLKNQELILLSSHEEAKEKLHQDREQKKQRINERRQQRENQEKENRLKDINAKINRPTEAASKPDEVVEAPEVVETTKPDEVVEAPEVVETTKPAVPKATSKPAESAKVVETTKPAVPKAARKPAESAKVVETTKPAVSKAAPKQPRPVVTPKVTDDAMFEVLAKNNKEIIEKDVEKFLKNIEKNKDTDIKVITTNLVIEETKDINSDQSFKHRDILIEAYNDLIEFFDNMKLKIIKDINNTLNEKDRNAQLLKIENSRATLLNLKNEVDKRNILQQIDKDIVYYKLVRDQEERLLQADYDYLKNTDTISDIERLIKYYTKFQEIILTYNSLDLSDFKPKDFAKIKAEILNFEEMIKPEQHLEKLILLKNLKELRDYYYSYINLKEIFVTSGQAAEYIDTTNIVFLIDFYRNIYTTQLVRINQELLKLNKKDSKKINSSILSLEKVVNANQSLKDLDILLEISNCKNNYYSSIMPIEINLHSFYRLEKEAVDIISILIKFYRSYLYISKKWSSKFSTLNEKDADKSRIVISSLNEVLNAERRLEELYIIHGHNIKAVYANLPSNYDESDEYIISNTMVLTNDIDPDIISEIITIYRRELGYCSTKLFLDNFYHKFEGKDEERKNFLIEDAKKLVNILEQRIQSFESWFNEHPTIDDNDIEKIKHIYLKYTEYTNDLIKEIQYTLDDDDESKISILDLLTTFSIQLIDSRKRLKIE